MNDIMDNPYYSTSIVRNTNMLFGRVLLLNRIYSALANRQSISLVGSRHMGKSSLLHCLRQPELQKQFEYDFSHYIFVLIDLREYRDKNSEDFFAAVSHQIILQSQGRIEKLSQEHGSELEFSSLLNQISEQKFHTILLMDAFDNVTRNSNFDLSFFSYLRSQATLGKISYVTATIGPLNNVCHQGIENSPFFNIFGCYSLEPFTQEEARNLIEEPASKAGMPFTFEEVEWILRLAGGHPFFLQQVCYDLFNEKLLQNREQQKKERRRIKNRIYAHMKSSFEAIWESLSEAQRQQIERDIQLKIPSLIQELSESYLFRMFVCKKQGITTSEALLAIDDVLLCLPTIEPRTSIPPWLIGSYGIRDDR